MDGFETTTFGEYLDTQVALAKVESGALFLPSIKKGELAGEHKGVGFHTCNGIQIYHTVADPRRKTLVLETGMDYKILMAVLKQRPKLAKDVKVSQGWEGSLEYSILSVHWDNRNSLTDLMDFYVDRAGLRREN